MIALFSGVVIEHLKRIPRGLWVFVLAAGTLASLASILNGAYHLWSFSFAESDLTKADGFDALSGKAKLVGGLVSIWPIVVMAAGGMGLFLYLKYLLLVRRMRRPD
jgi:hypothetical protein